MLIENVFKFFDCSLSLYMLYLSMRDREGRWRKRGERKERRGEGKKERRSERKQERERFHVLEIEKN